MKKRFIEWNLPIKEISEESAKERYITKGHPSSFHIWWARRPLASSRATNFAALIDLPENNDERNKILKIIESGCRWEALTKKKNRSIKLLRGIIQKQWGLNPPKILDPFSGGGSIPLETLRIGCETYANDLNPVAVIIEKATLEWPVKFGIMIDNSNMKQKQLKLDGSLNKVNLLSYLLEKWGKILINNLESKLKECYIKKGETYPLFYIWCKIVPCQNPSCKIEIPVFKQYWLSKKKGKMIALKPQLNGTNNSIEFIILHNEMIDFDPSEGSVSRGKIKCPSCKQIMSLQDIVRYTSQNTIEDRLICTIYFDSKSKKRKYRLVTESDIKNFEKSKIFLDDIINSWENMISLLPDEKIPKNGTIANISKYGIQNWSDLFNTRQKLILTSFLKELKSIEKNMRIDISNIVNKLDFIDSEELTRAIISYLALLLDMHAASNNRCTRWRSTAESTTRLYARPNLPWIWDYVEASPFTTAASSLKSFLKYYLKAIEINSIHETNNKINISNNSATNLPFEDNYFDAVITDPPYYDNISYAELSDFFYVWLKRSLGEYFPSLFATPLTPKSNEAIAHRIRHENPKEFFEEKIFESFQEIYRILKPDGILVVVYAHKSTSGWETLLNSLIKAGFVITASWPIHTEMKTRLLATSSATLASSIYMVCRKMTKKDVGFFNEIKSEIEKRIIFKLKQFWNEGMIGGDFFISVIGPAMEIFSRYGRIVSLSGEEITVKELLDFIRTTSTSYIVNKLLKTIDSSISIDKESQFYLSYRWTYLDRTVEFDDARKLASACGVDIEKLWGSKGFVKKNKSKISLLGPFDRKIISTPKTFVDAMHQCLILWKASREKDLKKLFEINPNLNNPLFWQFCQAVAESLLIGNTEKRHLEGFLTSKDRLFKQISVDQDLTKFIKS